MHHTHSLTPLAVIAFALTAFVLCFVYPVPSLEAAARGVSIWWEILFPALFPFFVLSEIMLKLGIVHFFGTLLDPLMRPLFRVPGIGGFVMAIGFASGYPVGAKMTAELYEKKAVNREEGERLISFVTTSDPIFLIGAVSVGFFQNPSLAPIFAAAHYGAAIIIGLLMRFYKKDSPLSPHPHSSSHPLLWRAFMAMHQARIQEQKPLSVLLKEAVGSSLVLVMIIGGLVVFFSVILEVLTVSNLIALMYVVVHGALSLFDVPSSLTESVISGFFEVTLGAKTAAEAGEGLGLVHKVAAAAFIVSWAGLSVHFQIISLLTRTPFRYRPFILCRLLHGIMASVLVYLLWVPLTATASATPIQVSWMHPADLWWVALGMQMSLLVFFIVLLCLGAIFFRLWR